MTYVSDGDIGGMVPACIKRRVMEEEGPIAGILDDLVEQDKEKT